MWSLVSEIGEEARRYPKNAEASSAPHCEGAGWQGGAGGGMFDRRNDRRRAGMEWCWGGKNLVGMCFISRRRKEGKR